LIPESFIQELLARVDIVELIDGHVPLKKAGANYAACCPFHSEKSPSFTVSPTKQFYHCFGCGAHGTAIGFLMEYTGLGFVDAIKDLAARTGMQVPDDDFHGRREGPPATDLVDIMTSAARYFREQLKVSPQAIDYLKRRGLTGEIAAKFGIGYAPDGWQNLEAAFPVYDSPDLQTAGLVIRNEQGRCYDRFRDRIMFPILSQKGEVIAFGGRVLGDGEPKYLNSPETPLFEKGREVFGLPQARASFREFDTAIVVEGYMDVVALAQHGVGNAVATLGTATTPTHIQKLLRQVDRIIFCFDGDNAGRKAAWRALENALEAAADNKMLAFAFLPPEHDPDSYVREFGTDGFRAQLAQALPLSEFLVQELSRRNDTSSAEGRARLLHEAKPLLTRLASPGLRLQIVKRLAEASASQPAEVERLCELKPLASTAAPPRRAPRRAPSLLRTVARVLLQKPELATRLPLAAIDEDSAEAAAVRTLHAALVAPGASVGTVIERCKGGPHADWIAEVSGESLTHPLSDEELESEFSGVLERLGAGRRDRELQQLAALARGGGMSDADKQRYLRLLQEKAQPKPGGQN
jgi:DNA primase